MERSKTENRSAFGAMREMLEMEADRVRDVRREKRDTPQAVIWRVAGRRDRGNAGWHDAVERRRPLTWLLLLSYFAKWNGFASQNLWSRKNAAEVWGEPPEPITNRAQGERAAEHR